jgi:hypothetical protein
MMSASWPGPIAVSWGWWCWWKCGASMRSYVADVSDMSGNEGEWGHFSSELCTARWPLASERFLKSENFQRTRTRRQDKSGG